MSPFGSIVIIIQEIGIRINGCFQPIPLVACEDQQMEGLMSTKRVKLGVRGLAALAIAGALTIGGAVAPASADGLNSVLGSNGTTVSLLVKGQSVNVSGLEAGVLYPYAFNTICNATATASGTRSTGAAWSKSWGTFSGCVPTSWVSVTNVGLPFKSGTTIRLQVRHDGFINAGKPQVGIWA